MTHYYYPRTSIVKYEGNKKPDTLSLTFGIPNKVREGYEVSYIQDIIDTTYLSGVYPMQLSCLDESGYDQDPTDPAESRFVKVTSGRYKGHYALDFTADGQGVSIPSNKITNIDLSKQFDINIWFTPATTQLQDGSDEPILWSFRSSDAGMDIGISGTNGNNNSWRGFVRYETTASSLISTMTGSSEKAMTGAPVYIRVKRGSDNVIRLYVNGVEDATASESNSLQPTSTPMVFGDTNDSTSDEYKGQIHLIKIYCGTDLTFEQSEKMRMSKPQVQFMKFAGKVRKIASDQAYKAVECQSNSYQLTRATLGSKGNSIDTHVLQASSGSFTSFKEILQAGVNEINSNFKVRVKDTFAETNLTSDGIQLLAGSIYEIGTFLQYASVLLLNSDTILYLTPRKNIIVESKTGHATDYVFDQNGSLYKYKITNSEDNDTRVINEVILTGRGTIKSNSSYTPSSGIRRTLRRNVLQLNTQSDLDGLAYRTRIDLQSTDSAGRESPPRKYIIQTPTPCHHVRYNHIVTVKRNNGNQVTTTDNISRNLNSTFIVKQIEHHFPSGKTIIKVGENDIDFFDDQVNVSKTQAGLYDNTL